MMKIAASDLKLGQRVDTGQGIGVIKFIGSTEFSVGTWIGIELETATGKNNGSVQGVSYFKCKENHGLFVRANFIKKIFVDDPVQVSTPVSKQQKEVEMANVINSPDISANVINSPNISANIVNSPNISAIGSPSLMSPVVESKSQLQIKRPSALSTPLTRLGKRSNENLSASKIVAPKKETPSRSIGGSTIGRRSREDIKSSLASPLERKLSDPSSAISTPNRKPVEQLAASQISTPDQNVTSNLIASLVNNVDMAPTNNEESTVSALESIKRTESTNILREAAQMKTLQQKNDDLLLRIRILEKKRADDREKIKQLEKNQEESVEAEALQSKFTGRLHQLQQELRECQKRLKETLEAKEENEAFHQEIQENMELLTLDKEMAEEKCESLQLELESLKEKMEEISLENEILKKEKELCEKGTVGDQTDLLVLSSQNERLKDALVKLRDVTQSEEAERIKTIKELEKELSELKDVKSNVIAYLKLELDQLIKTKEKLSVAEDSIEELKQLLDDATGAEYMVEQLTEKNLSLEEKLEQLKEEVEGLEELKEINDELEEQHIETERTLQEQIDELEIRLAKSQESLESMEYTCADYEATIKQFRDLVQGLQTELNKYRQLEQEHDAVSLSLASQSKTMLSLNLQLNSTASKSRSKQMELELKNFEVMQMKEIRGILERFLSESYFKGDSALVEQYFIIQGISFKASLASKYLQQRNDFENNKILCNRQLLVRIANITRGITSIFPCMSETEIKAIEKQSSMLKEYDAQIDSLIIQIQQDDVTDTSFLSKLNHLVESIYQALECIPIELHKFQLSLSAIEESDHLVERIVFLLSTLRAISPDDHWLEIFDTAYKFVMTAKQFVQKINKSLNEIKDQGGYCKGFNWSTQDLLRVADYLEIIYETFIRKKDNHENCLSLPETTPGESLCTSLKMINEQLSILQLDNVDKFVPSSNLWSSRSNAIKQDYINNIELSESYKKAQSNLLSLGKELQDKERTIQESMLRIDVLETKAATAKKHSETIKSLEEMIQKYKEHEKQYEEALDSIHADYDKAVKELVSRPAISVEHEQEQTHSSNYEDIIRRLHQANRRLKLRQSLSQWRFQVPVKTVASWNNDKNQCLINTSCFIKDVEEWICSARIPDLKSPKVKNQIHLQKGLADQLQRRLFSLQNEAMISEVR